ncbi:DoxX family protein [Microbacterium binotii]|jgi:thiosulfate dehydrogenase (quinone) large subunit|uniref:DoxX family membrane protein n=1 Tax=Microbacterium binotii TaxID=462710 RepID=A0ABP6BQL2_9MICO
MATITANVRAQVAAKPITAEASVVTSLAARRTVAIARFATGFIFLWAFLDKTFGLGFSTPVERAWINGGTPAQGFLNSEAVSGPFKGIFQAIATPLTDVLFMAGMLGVGLAVMLGIGMRVAAVAGSAIMLFMWMAEFPMIWGTGSTNPVVDYHIIYALMLIVFVALAAGETWGLGAQWRKLPIVQKNHWLI